MNKRDIIELLLKNGVMLTPEEAEKTDEKNYMQLLKKKLEGAEDDFVVIEPQKGRISSEEFVETHNKKFEFLRGLLLKKTDAVSINKGRKIFSEVTIIGRVKEQAARGFVLEDVTGETEVVSGKNHLMPGDVVGLKGHFKDNLFFSNQIIWPDVPLDGGAEPLGMSITLTTRVKEEMGGIIICPSARTAGNIIGGFGRLGTIKIRRRAKDLVVMAYSPSKEAGEEEAVMMLKKRLVPEEGIPDNGITEVPGIFWLFRNGRNWTRNYRGILIVSTAQENFAECHENEVLFGKI
jgi:hypothetical protein